MKIAILDDYQQFALRMADWSAVQARADVTVFDRNLAPAEAAEILAPFDVLCLMRERMKMPGELIRALPNLKLICNTGQRNLSLDVATAKELGITVCYTGKHATGTYATPELAWALMQSIVRHLPIEERNMRAGRWQTTIGRELHGKTLGLLGFGRIGRRMAEYARAFGMNVLAWSQNLTPEAAAAGGATWVEREELFARSDVVSIHLVLSPRTTGLVGAREFSLMQPTAYLVNTSRGPIVDEAAMLDALRSRRIAGAALDVFDIEPLPADHPLRGLDNVLLSPHLGYVVEEGFRDFYRDTVENILAFLDGAPIRQ
jgi:phosphoglycerate dehydrogenase-like enzyme